MERVGRLLGRGKVGKLDLPPEALARGAWPSAVGKRIAAHTGRITLVRTHLIVEVEDAVWGRQLFALRNQILPRLAELIGPGVVEDVEFRVAVPRPGPARVEPFALSGDEADGIQDPVLRRLYIASRKRASA